MKTILFLLVFIWNVAMGEESTPKMKRSPSNEPVSVAIGSRIPGASRSSLLAGKVVRVIDSELGIVCYTAPSNIQGIHCLPIPTGSE